MIQKIDQVFNYRNSNFHPYSYQVGKIYRIINSKDYSQVLLVKVIKYPHDTPFMAFKYPFVLQIISSNYLDEGRIVSSDLCLTNNFNDLIEEL